MSRLSRVFLTVLFLCVGLSVSSCAGATTSTPEQSAPSPTTPPPTEPIPPTETLAPPTPTQPPPTDTPPPTVTPTEEPIELNPSPRGYISMAYDSESKQVILFGGATGDENDPANYSGETWAFDVATQIWTEMKPPKSPSARSSSGSMVYDSESDRVILFGGTRTRNSTSRETWAYDYNTDTWTQMKGQGPAKHLGTAMAYDAESDRVILFGGFDFDSYQNFQDTWVYDYNTDTWTQMKPDNSPPGQNAHAMTYDPDSDRIILWGGYTKTPDPSNVVSLDSSVWAYDYNTNTWEQKVSSSAPGPRLDHALVYDANAGMVLMYGGSDRPSWTGQMTNFRDLLTYNVKSNTWESIPEPNPFPGTLSRFAMVYIPDTDQFIVFGGQVGGGIENYTNQTWIYDLNTNTWADVTREP